MPIAFNNTGKQSLLTPQIYDALEFEATIPLSFPEIAAFRPATFESVGFPTRIRDLRELPRYVDHLFEPAVGNLLTPGSFDSVSAYENAFTPDERELLQWLSDAAGNAQALASGRYVKPLLNHVVQIPTFRIVQAIARAAQMERLNIYEAGPGAGYLPGLLYRVGHRCMNFDITQGYYLWQSHLFAQIAGPDLCEMVLEGPQADITERRLIHAPWWQYLASTTQPPFDADLVISNANLGEMSSFSLRLWLETARRLLEKSSLGIFIFLHCGYCAQTSEDDIHATFRSLGYTRVPGLPFNCYVAPGHRLMDFGNTFAKGIPPYNPNDSAQRFHIRQFVRLTREELPPDALSSAWFHNWELPLSECPDATQPAGDTPPASSPLPNFSNQPALVRTSALSAMLDKLGDPLASPSMEAGKLLLELDIIQDLTQRIQTTADVPQMGHAILDYFQRTLPKDYLLELADDCLRIAVLTAPEDFRFPFWQAIIAKRRGDRERALALFQRAAGLFSGSTLAFMEAAEILDAIGRSQDAGRYRMAAWAAAPRYQAAVLSCAHDLSEEKPVLAADLYVNTAFAKPEPLYGRSFGEFRRIMEERLRQPGPDGSPLPTRVVNRQVKMQPGKEAAGLLDAAIYHWLEESLTQAEEGQGSLMEHDSIDWLFEDAGGRSYWRYRGHVVEAEREQADLSPAWFASLLAQGEEGQNRTARWGKKLLELPKRHISD